MSSGAAVRARQLLPTSEADSIESIKEKIRSPSPASTPSRRNTRASSRSKRRSSTGQQRRHHAEMESSAPDSSARVKEILGSMKEKRESFDSFVQDSKSPGGSSKKKSNKASPKQSGVPDGKPPRAVAHSAERDEILRKMKDSLKEKRQRISNIHKAEKNGSLQERHRSSQSPQTVGTTATEESASSSASWAVDMGGAAGREKALGSKGSRDNGKPTRSSSNGKDGDTQRSSKKKGKEHFKPIHLDGFETDHSSSRGTTEDSKSSPRSATTHSGDKKVSFDKNLEVIEETAPPAVVHCMSFESTLSKDRSSSAYTPTKKSLSPSPKRTSRDTSNLDEGLTRMLRYSALVNDRDRRISLMRQLEQTFTELQSLHEELENEKLVPQQGEAESDLSDEIPEDEDDSSCDFTNDSNTSGWSSTGETNSKLDSLLQYMTSEEGSNSLTESFQSFGRFSFTLSKSESNLETLQENDETEGHEHLESEGDEKPALPLSPKSMASTITGSDVIDSVDNVPSIRTEKDKKKKSSRTNDLKIDTSVDFSRSSKDAPGGTQSIASFYRVENDRHKTQKSSYSPKTADYSTPTSQDATVYTSHKKDSVEKKPSTREHVRNSTTSSRSDPEGDRVENGGKSIKIEGLPTVIPRDPTEDFSLKGAAHSTEKKSVKQLARDPSGDDKPEGNDTKDSNVLEKPAAKQLARDPSADNSPENNATKSTNVSKSPAPKQIAKDPSCDNAPENNDNSVLEKPAAKQLARDPSVEDTPGVNKKEDIEEVDPMINAIRENRAVSQGIVRRAINKWEATKDPRKPDPPILEIVINRDVASVQNDEAMPNEAVDVKEDPSNMISKEAESQKAQDEITGVPSVVEFVNEADMGNTEAPVYKESGLPVRARKKSRKFLFAPRQLANERCKALGGLFDIAKKTGISTSSTICVKSRYIPRPPSLIAINAEFQCGTQGSLYDLARRSGCPVLPTSDDEEEPKKVVVPKMVDGKRRWMLKTRGGHHHISVWTTLGNKVVSSEGN